MHALIDDLLDDLRRIVGDAHVLTRHATDDTNLGAWENDWRRRSQGQALAVVQPVLLQANDITLTKVILVETSFEGVRNIGSANAHILVLVGSSPRKTRGGVKTPPRVLFGL